MRTFDSATRAIQPTTSDGGPTSLPARRAAVATSTCTSNMKKRGRVLSLVGCLVSVSGCRALVIRSRSPHHEVDDRVFSPVAVVVAATLGDEAAVSAVLAQAQRDVRVAED